jgi:hypothetical protein
VYGVALIQFVCLIYDPISRVPTARHVEAGRQIVQLLREAPGEVWVPYHGHLATLAGKKSYANWMAITDVLVSHHSRPDARARLQAEIDAAVDIHRFSLVVDSNRPFSNSPNWHTSYALRGEIFRDPNAFLPSTGTPRRPDRLYAPVGPGRPDRIGRRDQAYSPAGVRVLARSPDRRRLRP